MSEKHTSSLDRAFPIPTPNELIDISAYLVLGVLDTEIRCIMISDGSFETGDSRRFAGNVEIFLRSRTCD